MIHEFIRVRAVHLEHLIDRIEGPGKRQDEEMAELSRRLGRAECALERILARLEDEGIEVEPWT